MTVEITNTDDMIDVRDVIARVEHLRALRTPGPVDLGDDNETDQDTLFAELRGLEKLLADLAGEGGDSEWEGDWYPVGLIADDYFVEAMRELCLETSDLPQDIPTYIVIDWEATAENLRVDYSSVEFDGVTYWYR